MTRRSIAGLLLLAVLAPGPTGRSDNTVPDMPPRRLQPTDVEALRAQKRIVDVDFSGTPLGVLLLPAGNAFLGSYVEDRQRGDYEEVGAWKAELVSCPSTGSCDAIAGEAAKRLIVAYQARNGAPTPTSATPSAPNPVAEPPAQPKSAPLTLPPVRLNAAAMQGEIARGHVSLVNHPNGTVTGFLLDCPGEQIGGYLLETSTTEYVEVLAHRGEAIDPTRGAADALNAAGASLVRVHGSETGWAAAVPWTRAGTAEPYTPVQRASLTSPVPPTVAPTQATAVSTTSAAASASAAPSSAPPAAAPRPTALPPLLSVEGVLERVVQHPISTGVSLVALVLLIAVFRTPARRAPSGERVVITHEEHERAAARLQQRLLADKAKLERLNSEVEAEESKLIERVAHITRRM